MAIIGVTTAVIGTGASIYSASRSSSAAKSAAQTQAQAQGQAVDEQLRLRRSVELCQVFSRGP